MLEHFLEGFTPEPAPRLPPGVQLAPGVDAALVAGMLLRQVLRGGEGVVIVGRVEAALRAPASPKDRPRWDADARELHWGGKVIRWFRGDAANQCAVLAAFEAAGWPRCIQDPLPRLHRGLSKVRRWETLKSLNRGLPLQTIRFRSNGAGDGIRWDLVI
jgi:hypothetical protein